MVKLTCIRCSHSWHRRKPENPKTCPKCRSPYWDKERKPKKGPKKGQNEDDKFLKLYLLEMGIPLIDGKNKHLEKIDAKSGLRLDSVKNEWVPINVQDLCKVFSAALKYARGDKSPTIF